MSHPSAHRQGLHRLAVRVRVVRRRASRRAIAVRRAVVAAWRRLVGAMRRGIRRAIPLAILAVLGFGVGGAIAVTYGQFGAHPGRNATTWAIRPAVFEGTSSCAACHPSQVATWASAAHQGISCESCHGPLAGHPAVDPSPSLLAPVRPVEPVAAQGASALAIDATAPTALCLSCHEAVVGRPAGFPAIDPATHFTGPSCVECHDPHAAVAPAPPDILHPLAGMPECTFCHNPTGMRPLPQGHPTWSGSCLACHKALQS